MKYKTIIEITADADNKDEASEIAGEYLSGNIHSGVSMKCSTRPASSYKRNVVSVIMVMVLFIIGVFSTISAKPSHNMAFTISGNSAIQPPLKTDKKNADFKKDWQDRQVKEVLDYLKK